MSNDFQQFTGKTVRKGSLSAVFLFLSFCQSSFDRFSLNDWMKFWWRDVQIYVRRYRHDERVLAVLVHWGDFFVISPVTGLMKFLFSSMFRIHNREETRIILVPCPLVLGYFMVKII